MCIFTFSDLQWLVKLKHFCWWRIGFKVHQRCHLQMLWDTSWIWVFTYGLIWSSHIINTTTSLGSLGCKIFDFGNRSTRISLNRKKNILEALTQFHAIKVIRTDNREKISCVPNLNNLIVFQTKNRPLVKRKHLNYWQIIIVSSNEMQNPSPRRAIHRFTCVGTRWPI